MKARFGRRYLMSASHRLHVDALSADENRATYGKCNNPHGHGHNYVVEVLVAHLNLDPLFVNRVPTTENLCRTVFDLLDGAFGLAKLERVRVEETENNFFECSSAVA